MRIMSVVAAFVGGVVMFMLGGVIFGMLMMDYFRMNMIEYAGLAKDPPLYWAIFAFNLAWAALITFVMEYAGRVGWAEGAKVGAIVMFLLGVGMNLDIFAFLNIHKAVAPMIVHIIVIMVMGAITGAAIGVVLGFGKRDGA